MKPTIDAILKRAENIKGQLDIDSLGYGTSPLMPIIRELCAIVEEQSKTLENATCYQEINIGAKCRPKQSGKCAICSTLDSTSKRLALLLATEGSDGANE